MKRQDYYPSAAEEQVLWLLNFANSLPAHATALRIAAGTLANAIADALWVAYTLGPWRGAVRTFAKAATAAIEAVQTSAGGGVADLPAFTLPPPGDAVLRPPGALKRIFRLVQIIKANAACTAAMRQALRIVTITDDREHPAPSLEVSVERGAKGEEAVLRMEKWDHIALHIESRRGGGDWERLTVTSLTTFRDQRPLLAPGQPEVREYRVRYFEGSAPTGEWSAEVKVTLSP